ncbi:MAG TPA: C-terminal helicase domain-containing protein, partial [Kofleriaceae bacterium]
HVLGDAAMTRALVFTRTKSGANRVTRELQAKGIQADVIHGNKSQNARERALDSFRAGSIRVLVATDIAARGIDIDDVTHVVNFDVPEVPETYVHRIGRTARAGASGMALTFVEADERADWRNILKLTRQDIPVVEGHPYESRVPMNVIPPSISPRERAQRERREERAEGGGQNQGRGGNGGGAPRHANGGGGGGGGGNNSSGGGRRRRRGRGGFGPSATR